MTWRIFPGRPWAMGLDEDERRAAPDAALEMAPIRGGGGGVETACFEVFP